MTITSRIVEDLHMVPPGIIAAREQRSDGINVHNEHWGSYPQSQDRPRRAELKPTSNKLKALTWPTLNLCVVSR